MSEVPLLFNGDPLSKLEAQTGLGSPAGCAATEMIGLPGWSSMMFTAGVGEMSVTFRGKESIPDAHGFSDKDLLVGLETLDRLIENGLIQDGNVTKRHDRCDLLT